MAKSKQEGLEPADPSQCQAQYQPGSFMTFGPRDPIKQCEKIPSWILTENKPGEDGLIGSMSVCDDCKIKFLRRFGKDHATIIPIKPVGMEEKKNA